jgi:hypothetical protein
LQKGIRWRLASCFCLDRVGDLLNELLEKPGIAYR